MWKVQYQKEYKDISIQSIWNAWMDVNNWPKWDAELEQTSMKESPRVGTKFELKPKGGPAVTIEITELTPLKSFTDVAKFPLAKMYDVHVIEKTTDGVLIKSEISVTGPLAWLWKKLVAQGVADGVPTQTDALVAYAQEQEKNRI